MFTSQENNKSNLLIRGSSQLVEKNLPIGIIEPSGSLSFWAILVKSLKHAVGVSQADSLCDGQSRCEEFPVMEIKDDLFTAENESIPKSSLGGEESEKSVKENCNRVPVVSASGKPLMPCHPARARELIRKGKAIPRFRQGYYYIKLLFRKDGALQPIACGIDPGTKREAFTLKSEKQTLLNVLIDCEGAKDIVKRLESRKSARKSRRFNRTPYRKNKENRKGGALPPSIKWRWDLKLRQLKILSELYPIEAVVYEDIAAVSKKGQRNWNKSFSVLEVGKQYFFDQVKKLISILNIKKGYETYEMRCLYGLQKSKKKLEDNFYAHNVDSWVLANSYVGGHVEPDNTSMYKVEPILVSRRQLYFFNTLKGGIRRRYGGTISHGGIVKGTVVRYKDKAAIAGLRQSRTKYGYVGGYSVNGMSLHSLEDKKRITQSGKVEEGMYKAKWAVKLIPLQTKQSLSGFPGCLR